MTRRSRWKRLGGFALLIVVVGAPVSAGAPPPSSVPRPALRLSPPPRSFSVVMSGDVLNEDSVNAAGVVAAAGTSQRYDFAPLFLPVEPIIASADLAICHMELPLGRPGAHVGYSGRSPYGGNLLVSPYEVADSLHRTGFDRCSTASNHSNDVGTAGIDSTLDALDDAGITHAGTARTRTDAAPTVFTVNGIRVAHLAYTRYSNTTLPPESWQLNFAVTPEQIAADVVRVRVAGAEVVIVSIHLSQEMQRGPSPDDRAFATRLTALAPIDLIVHHGPHVVQPVERVNGTVVYWSVGNLISGMGIPGRGRYEDPRSLDGFLASVRFTEKAPGVFTAETWTVLICNERASRTVRAPVTELERDGLPAGLRAEMRACIDRTLLVEPALH